MSNIRPMRTQGGTLYTFNSALEDIGLNINESKNTVKLTNYALLDIPECSNSGDFNILPKISIPFIICSTSKRKPVSR